MTYDWRGPYLWESRFFSPAVNPVKNPYGQISVTCKCASLQVHVLKCVWGWWSCIEWQGHASWTTWIYLGQTRGAHVCLGPSLPAVGPQSHEQKVPFHNSHLSSSQPGTNLSVYLSPHAYCLFSLFLSLPSVSPPLLSQAMAWPTFTSPTLQPLMSNMFALSTNHVYVQK